MRRRAAFPWTAALGAVWIALSVLVAAATRRDSFIALNLQHGF